MTRLRPWKYLAALLLCGAGVAHAALPIEQWIHPSGARVHLVSSPAIPMLDLSVDFDAGSRRDPAAQAGLARATASMLDKGLAAADGQPALDENALAEAWLDLGAQFGASASSDRMGFALRSLTEPALLARATALAARQLAHPAFPEAVWARERERSLAALREAETRPGTHAGRAYSRAVYQGHPYGQETTADSLRAIGVADMARFYRQHVMACGARVSLVGAIDRAAADRIVGQLMAGIASHGCRALPNVPEVAPLAAPREERIVFAAAQAQVLLGQPGIRRDDPDFLTLLVGNHILGASGFTSRLMDEVREKRGLTYGVYSSLAPGRHAGAFTISLQTRPDQAEAALALSREVLTRFVAEGPTAAELQAAKDALIKGFALRLDSNRKLLDNVANLAWNDLPLDYLDTWTTKVAAVTVDDIRRAFQRVLAPDRMVSVIVGGKAP
ncbi:M16 family metallopeptidase [Hydrogenophaga sp. OTU3427]|uniref:M16 family metallopeptidase n=1 Tax=Hydrogenophaga sp. OTU3427 TaxID=3043856 RepID=UPI00313E7A04